MIGNEMYSLAERLFPICRSITGDGVRQTLSILKEYIPELSMKSFPTGKQVFDWIIPEEWKISEAYIEDSSGKRVIDFKENNLHVMGYSDSLDVYCTKQELKKYVFTQEDQPDWIPYVTSYYKKRAGFCMSRNQWDTLPEDQYHAVIKSELFQGRLDYGEVIIKGDTDEEVFLSTYICHPSMANNELSGPCLCTYLYKWLKTIKNRRYTYRFIFIPETIGSIAYLSENLLQLKKNVIVGFVVTCVGDERTYSYVPSRKGDTLADRAALNVLRYYIENYDSYTFLDRGSDERQYNSPGIDLPICVVCRSKYSAYPEYHTSADNMQLISSKGLYDSYQLFQKIIETIEANRYYKTTCLCEPQLGKRNLYASISKKENFNQSDALLNILAYADGETDLIEISEKINIGVVDLKNIVQQLIDNELLLEK